jgi:hypothetical protein
MSANAFHHAAENTSLRGALVFDDSTETTVQVGIPGAPALRDYSLIGLPLAKAKDTVTIDNVSEGVYTLTVRGKRYTYESNGIGGSNTVANPLKAALDADADALGIVTATVTYGFSVTAKVPGVGLGLSCVGPNADDVSIVRGLADGPSVGVIDKQRTRLTARSASAISARFEILIVG